jgi:hypothetical protein
MSVDNLAFFSKNIWGLKGGAATFIIFHFLCKIMTCSKINQLQIFSFAHLFCQSSKEIVTF